MKATSNTKSRGEKKQESEKKSCGEKRKVTKKLRLETTTAEKSGEKETPRRENKARVNAGITPSKTEGK